MRHFYAGFIASVLLSACAQAQPPVAPVTTAQPARQPAMSGPILDTEPDVTQQVNAILVRLGKGAVPVDNLTENAKAAMTPANTMPMGAKLRPCGEVLALQLLERKTKGEERQYVYRAPCGGNALLVEINFGKGSRISHLAVRPEKVH